MVNNVVKNYLIAYQILITLDEQAICVRKIVIKVIFFYNFERKNNVLFQIKVFFGYLKSDMPKIMAKMQR